MSVRSLASLDTFRQPSMFSRITRTTMLARRWEGDVISRVSMNSHDVREARSIALQRELTWERLLVLAYFLQECALAPKEFGVSKVARVRAFSSFCQRQHFIDGLCNPLYLVPYGVNRHGSEPKGARS